ncbi:unnamed protein product [Bursaphelenchus xylophilus]|uniref:(pine wood nematode) hypothetical protein n=1 Tax=Bursaphelenchus xylophilus TaxID=6326 RepID=A0A1I7RS37_BURXY|nr:unnamed protein product [Bursaphelenchus xylophilus]CAG9123256.1 unnamed protein product [Bursaphelenchus xylophilus]
MPLFAFQSQSRVGKRDGREHVQVEVGRVGYGYAQNQQTQFETSEVGRSTNGGRFSLYFYVIPIPQTANGQVEATFPLHLIPGQLGPQDAKVDVRGEGPGKNQYF